MEANKNRDNSLFVGLKGKKVDKDPDNLSNSERDDDREATRVGTDIRATNNRDQTGISNVRFTD